MGETTMIQNEAYSLVKNEDYLITAGRKFAEFLIGGGFDAAVGRSAATRTATLDVLSQEIRKAGYDDRGVQEGTNAALEALEQWDRWQAFAIITDQLDSQAASLDSVSGALDAVCRTFAGVTFESDSEGWAVNRFVGILKRAMGYGSPKPTEHHRPEDASRKTGNIIPFAHDPGTNPVVIDLGHGAAKKKHHE